MQTEHHWPQWTPEEDTYLREHAPHTTAQEIATALGRTWDAVRDRARKHDIVFRRWSAEDLTTLSNASNEATTTELASLTGRSQLAVRRKLRELGQARKAHIVRRHYAINDHAFDSWSEAAGYWMGFIAADGCLKRYTSLMSAITVQLAERDVEHLERLRAFLEADHPIKQQNGKAVLHVSSPALFGQLMCLGVTPHKTQTLTFPSLPSSCLSHFVRGYFDGDGSTGWAKDGGLFWNLLGTEAFLLGVASHLPVKVTVRKRSDCNIFRIQVGGNNAACILRWMYRDAPYSCHESGSAWLQSLADSLAASVSVAHVPSLRLLPSGRLRGY